MASLTLKQKILGGMLALSITGCAIAVTGIWVTSNLSRVVDEIRVISSLAKAHAHADMMHDAMRADAISALASLDPSLGIDLKEVEAQVAEHGEAFLQDIALERSVESEPEIMVALKTVEEPLAIYIEGAHAIVKLSRTDAAAAKAALPDFITRFKGLEEAMGSVSELIDRHVTESNAEAQRFENLGRILMMSGLVFGLVFSGLLIWLALTQMLRPLVGATTVLNRLADGDLTIEVAETERRDEIGQMIRALRVFKAQAERNLENDRTEFIIKSLGEGLENLSSGNLGFRLNTKFPDKMERLRTYFNTAADSLAETLLSIKAGTEEIRGGTAGIAQASDDLSRRTESQAASLEETAAAMAEITSGIQKTAEGASRARSAVSEAKSDADHGGTVVSQAVTAMQNIENSSNKINQIIGVIDEIAFQTNLLALNAGVEAARAGDAGRGFAVVASEVRALAQKSADAAKEIETLLRDSRLQIGDGVKLVAETGQSLRTIIDRVTQINTVVTDIAANTEQQALGLKEVNASVNLMDQMTQQNAAMVEQANAATKMLTDQSGNLAQLIAKFNTVNSAGRQIEDRAAA